MVRKKKEIDLGFTPSPYQAKLFDWVQHGTGNGVIRASAGSGKSVSAVTAIKLIPSKEKCQFIAFNRSIAEELNDKLKNNPNAFARTFHSLGYLMIRRNVGEVSIDEYKYRTYVKSHITELTTIEQGTPMTKFQVYEYIESICLLVNFARLYVCQTTKEIEEIADKYDVPVSFDECAVALRCMEWGKTNLETIDYTDMVWLPVELSMKPLGLQFDWMMVDEAQDLSVAAIKLFQKCIKRGGRFLAIGDESQTINSFSGSYEGSFGTLLELPNTQAFTLPITYRCPKKIVDFAAGFINKDNEIIAKDDAIEGEIRRNCHVKDLKDGDMVLARSKAPLLKLYVKLLRRGVNCYIKGQDIGKNLIKILESVKETELNPKLDKDGVFVRLYERLFSERNKTMEKRGLDFDDATTCSPIMEKYDTLNALTILAEKYTNKYDLIEHIDEIFTENAKGVCLSTVHKAKGLEADNVYILCNSTMPSKLAKHEWEKQQERNLQFVAYTRSKKLLGFISEKEIKPNGISQDPMEIINELIYIENQVCNVLGKEPTKRMENAEIAKFNLRSMTEVKDIHEEDNKVVMKPIIEMTNNKSENILVELDKLLNL